MIAILAKIRTKKTKSNQDMNKFIFSLALCAAAAPAFAHTDLLNQNFDKDWTQDFTVLELDNLPPATAINSAFMDSDGVSWPWWPVKDSSQSTDRFLASHSYYQSAGTSNDWVTSRPLTIPTTGFKLIFDAQSLPIRSGEDHALSDLRVFITEQPVTKDWQPTEPTLLLEQVSYGENRDLCEGDFKSFTMDLDAYVGKTIYISFANLNSDKDVLAINNVLVRRLDVAEMTVDAPQYIPAGEYNVKVNIKGTDGEGLKNWKLTFKSGETEKTESGAALAVGESKDFVFTATAEPKNDNAYTVTLSADNNPDIVAGGNVAGMLFETTKRILVEETTGSWCGNCPMAIYTMEQLEENEKYAGRILPVAIHVGNDMMVDDNYSYMFGLGTVAPFVRVDRQDELIGFAPVDCAPDPDDQQKAAHSIVAHLDDIALGDVNVSGSYLKNAGKISGIDATAEFIPAIDMEGADYQIGFILTENNVTPSTSSSVWFQHNYVNNDEIALAANNPWGKLPDVVKNMHYQDVARYIYDFRGLENSLPERTLKAGEKVQFNTQLGLPELGEKQGELNPENLYLTVFVIEKGKDICTIVNANRVALGENPEPKVTSQEMLDEWSGVDSIAAETEGEAEYYNLQGIRVAEPEAGVYIVRRGNKVTKEVVR